MTAKHQSSLLKTLNECLFYIGGQPIEKFLPYSHFGHVLNCTIDGILQRLDSFVGQTNNFLCVLNKLDTFVKLELFKAYCNSMDGGCELLSLDSHIKLIYFVYPGERLCGVYWLPRTAPVLHPCHG
jgi:hypothetical protein